MSAVRRLPLMTGREHLTITGEFQSDKYPWCPAGFVPIKVTDPMAADLLGDYAARRKVVDKEFTRDLYEALGIVARQDHDPDCTCMDRMDCGRPFPRHDWRCSCGFRKRELDL